MAAKPLDYPDFTRFLEAHDSSLMANAAERRKLQLVRQLNQDESTISVTFSSPRPLQSTDLLEDLRCLIQSIDMLETENKRLRGRCSYLSTINDLLFKQQKPVQHENSPLLAPKAQSLEVKYLEAATSPAAVSPLVDIKSEQRRPSLIKQASVSEEVKIDTAGPKNMSFSAKMSKAASKLLPGKFGSKSKPSAKSVRNVKSREFNGLELSDSASSIPENRNAAIIRSRSFVGKDKSELISHLNKVKVTGNPKRLSSSESLAIEYEPEHSSLTDSVVTDQGHRVSMESLEKLHNQQQHQQPQQSEEKHHLQLQQQQQQLLPQLQHHLHQQQPQPVMLIQLPEHENKPVKRERAWTWDVAPKQNSVTPWQKLKQMLRRSSTPYDDSPNITNLPESSLKSAVTQHRRFSQLKENVEHQPRPKSPTPAAEHPPLSNETTPVAKPRHHASDVPVNVLAKTLQLMAMTGSSETNGDKENQKKLIARALNALKNEEDSEIKLEKLDIVELIVQNTKPAIASLFKYLWNDYILLLNEARTIKRSYLSDRLKLLEWTNIHCSRLLDSRVGQCSNIQKRLSGRGDEAKSGTRYDESTGLCFGPSRQLGKQKRTYKAKRRWYSIGAGDRSISPIQREASGQLASSLCNLFSSLEPLNSKVLSSNQVIPRCDTVMKLFNEVKRTVDEMKQQVELEQNKIINVTMSVIHNSENSKPVTIHSQPMDIRMVQSDIQSGTSKRDITQSFSNEPQMQRPRKMSQHTLMSADELVTVARSRSSSLASSTLVSPLSGNSCSSISEKRKSIADALPSSRKDLPSMAAVAKAVDFAKNAASRTRSSSIGSRNKLKPVSEMIFKGAPRGNIIYKPKEESDDDLRQMETKEEKQESPKSKEEQKKEMEKNESDKIEEKHLKTAVENVGSNISSDDEMFSSNYEKGHFRQDSIDHSDNPDGDTPPLISPSQRSSFSVRTYDLADDYMLKSRIKPAVARTTPKITVSPDGPHPYNRGRIKSLIELSTNYTPIGRIFGEGTTTSNMNRYNRISYSPTKSVPGGSPSLSLKASQQSISSDSSNSKATVVALLSPPPILSDASSSAGSSVASTAGSSAGVGSFSSSTESRQTDSPAKNYEQRQSTATISTEAPYSRSRPRWYNKLFRHSPSPLKRFSSCGVGPSTMSEPSMLSGISSSTPHSRSPSSDSRSQASSQTTGQKQSKMFSLKRFLRRDSKSNASGSGGGNVGQ